MQRILTAFCLGYLAIPIAMGTPSAGQGVYPVTNPGAAGGSAPSTPGVSTGLPNPPMRRPPTRVPFQPPPLNAAPAVYPSTQPNPASGAAPAYPSPSIGRPTGSQSNAAQHKPAPVGSKPIEEAEIIARINGELVQKGEVLPRINAFLKQNEGQVPESMISQVKRQAMQQYLDQIIDSKLVYADFRSAMKENLPNVEKKIAEQFEKLRMPTLLETAKVDSRAELEEVLRKEGSSIDAQRKLFGERAIFQQWVGSQVKTDVTITRDQMLKHYRANLAKYEFQAKVLWDELYIRFDSHDTKQQAFNKTAELGNRILSGQAPFAAIAKEHSEGFTADEGGRRDWTTKGSLKDQQIDRALFELPVGTMSQIIKGENGYRIVRVVERKEAGRTPFRDAQVEIKEQLRKDHRDAQIKEYLAKLRKNARVWTIFDDQPQISGRGSDGVRR